MAYIDGGILANINRSLSALQFDAEWNRRFICFVTFQCEKTFASLFTRGQLLRFHPYIYQGHLIALC